MSVFQLGTDTTDKLFYEYIMPGLNIEIRENTVLYDRFKTDTEHVVGKYAVFKCMSKTPMSARPSSSSTMPTAKQGTYQEFVLYMKRGMYASLQFDGLALACGKGSKAAIMDILRAEIKGIEIHMSNKLNQQFWGDGSGRMARLYGAVSNSTTAYVDGALFGQDSNDYTNPAMYLYEGKTYDFYSSAGALEAEDIEITTIVDGGDGTATLTLGEAITASDNGFIFEHDTYAASQAAGTGVPQGIHGIIDDADPYTGITQCDFQGIDRATYAWACSQVVDMGSLAVTDKKMLETCQLVERFGRVKVILTNNIIWNSYFEIAAADRTLPSAKKLWGGLTGLTFYGGRTGEIPIIYDTDCPDNKMYFIDDSYIQVYAPVKNGMNWIPGDSGKVLTRVQGKDEFTANMVFYYNLGSEKPQALGLLDNVKHASS